MQCKQVYDYSCLSMVYIRDNGSEKINGLPDFHIETLVIVSCFVYYTSCLLHGLLTILSS